MLIRAFRILPLLSILLAAQPAQDPTVLARKALNLVLAAQYAEFLQMSTADVQKSLPEAEMAKLGAMIKTYGAMEKLADPSATRSGPNSEPRRPHAVRLLTRPTGESGAVQEPVGLRPQRRGCQCSASGRHLPDRPRGFLRRPRLTLIQKNYTQHRARPDCED